MRAWRTFDMSPLSVSWVYFSLLESTWVYLSQHGSNWVYLSLQTTKRQPEIFPDLIRPPDNPSFLFSVNCCLGPRLGALVEKCYECEGIWKYRKTSRGLLALVTIRTRTSHAALLSPHFFHFLAKRGQCFSLFAVYLSWLLKWNDLSVWYNDGDLLWNTLSNASI